MIAGAFDVHHGELLSLLCTLSQSHGLEQKQ